jgi:ABC-type branched-subunit amino acid transport system ATPase component
MNAIIPNESPPLRLRLQNLGLAFGAQALVRGVNLDLAAGEIGHLTGENGSGKSSILNAISGISAPSEGKIELRLDGDMLVDPAKTTPERIAALGLGRLWQETRLHGSLTVLENVLIGMTDLPSNNPFLAVSGLPFVRRCEREAREEAMHRLERFGLGHKADSLASELSVGEMKRVALARIIDAQLFLLDEPLAGVDVGGVEFLIDEIAKLQREGRTLLIVEHREELISALQGKVWLLKDGTLTAGNNSHV